MSCSCRIACIGRLTLFASVAVMMLLAAVRRRTLRSPHSKKAGRRRVLRYKGD